MFIRFHKKRPKKIVIDIDITDDPLHGNQEGRFITVITGGTATPPLTYSAGAICLGVGSAKPTRILRRERRKN